MDLHDLCVQLRAERDALHAAMAELVALKDLKDKADRGVTTAGNAAERGMCATFQEKVATLAEYERRKPAAWQRARELVWSNVELTGTKQRAGEPD